MQRSSPSQVEREYFDDRIADEGEFDAFAPEAWETLRRRFDEFVPPVSALRILDVGAGTGQSRKVYERTQVSYIGSDLSWSCVRTASSSLGGRWLQADALTLPFGNESFDVVAFSSVLHHIPAMTSALREAMRVLRPGGYAFAFDPNLRHPAMALLRHPKSPLYIRAGVSPNERPLLPRELRAAFSAAGFESIHTRCQSGIAYRHVAPRLINALLALYNGVDRAVEWSGLGRLIGTFVVTTARKPEQARV